MTTTPEHNRHMAEMTFSTVFPLYLAKVERKGRTKEELLEIIQWLTGFNENKLAELIHSKVTFEDFFKQANLHPNAHLINGLICGYRIEEIENKLTQKVRNLDKLVDELAKEKE